ncbi:MAG: ribosome biogenesis GTP-binding protein YihA/YsxC [Bacteroidota bacterium]|nr:ribosome biogenesis GTP-binding protein YihA/YsxC [Bacteroidota bacterium]
MQINSSRFIMSNTNVAMCPQNFLPEYAFIGISNVGKSSLINSICGKKDLAKTSSTPGKTILINHYIINESWYLVDLPGYGYARISKTKKEEIRNLTKNYFKKRKQLINAFLLIDIRHEPQSYDLDFMIWLNKNFISFAIIFTKSDKLKNNSIDTNVLKYKNVLNKNWDSNPPMFVTSSKKKTGNDRILEYIKILNSEFYKYKRA